MPRSVDLLAIDLDGTLVDHTGRISDRNIQAIRRARAAGLHVTICTGRALIETRDVAARIDQTDPVIVSGGAMLACPLTDRTISRFAMDPGLIAQVVGYLLERGRPALILKDQHAAGFDYLVVGAKSPSDLDPASRRWFEKMRVRARFVPSLDHDDHPEHTVRIGAYSANIPVATLAAELHDRFGAVAMFQHFTGVLLPAERRAQGIESVHIVELFDPKADKWQALERLANHLNIPLERTAAIGDQTNDLSMITHAGLGIAMGNAHPTVAAAADRHTARCEDDGVAQAIDHLLAGTW
jgi:hydroxymethylpyrimidine pyrophosphatase-like HAD family hydrolase